MSELVDKFGWDKIIQTVMGALLIASILGLFGMNSKLISLEATISERQKSVVKAERLATVEALALENEKDIAQLHIWLRRLSDRVNSR